MNAVMTNESYSNTLTIDTSVCMDRRSLYVGLVLVNVSSDINSIHVSEHRWSLYYKVVSNINVLYVFSTAI